MKHFSEGNQEEHEYDHNMSASKHVAEDRAYVVVDAMFTPEDVMRLKEARNKPGGNPLLAAQENNKDIIEIVNKLDTYYADFNGCMITDDTSNEWINKEDLLNILKKED